MENPRSVRLGVLTGDVDRVFCLLYECAGSGAQVDVIPNEVFGADGAVRDSDRLRL